MEKEEKDEGRKKKLVSNGSKLLSVVILFSRQNSDTYVFFPDQVVVGAYRYIEPCEGIKSKKACVISSGINSASHYTTSLMEPILVFIPVTFLDTRRESCRVDEIDVSKEALGSDLLLRGRETQDV